MPTQLTILVPVFNEQECLRPFKEAMDQYLRLTPIHSEVLFVDDDSTDRSLAIICSLCAEDERYRYLSLAENGGLSTALKAGFDHVLTPWIGYIDADLQTVPEDFVNYFPYLDSYAMINGIRARRQDRFLKKLSSRLANRFRRVMINDGIADTCCPLKIIDTAYAKRLPFFRGMHRFLPALVQLQGGRVRQVEVRHFKRFAGTAKYHFWNRLVAPFFDTLAFIWMKKRYIRYQVAERSPVATVAAMSAAAVPKSVARL